jgi:hypothetical protein
MAWLLKEGPSMKSTNHNSSNKHHHHKRRFRIRPISKEEPDLDQVADAVLMSIFPKMISQLPAAPFEHLDDPVWEVLPDVDQAARTQRDEVAEDGGE